MNLLAIFLIPSLILHLCSAFLYVGFNLRQGILPCVGKMVISNYRLNSTRLITLRKEITILPIVSSQIMGMTQVGLPRAGAYRYSSLLKVVLYLAMPGSWAQCRTGGFGQHLREQTHR